MNINKIKAMEETLEKMEKMQKETFEDINKDIDKKRVKALKEIRKYMDNLAKTLNGRTLKIEIDKGKIFYDGTILSFNEKAIISNRNGLYDGKETEEKINWFFHTYHYETSYNYIDNKNEEKYKENWKTGFIELIENWNEIKEEIENKLVNELEKQMNRTRELTQNKIEKYKKVDDFEV